MRMKITLLVMCLALTGCAIATPHYNLLTERDNPEIAVRIFDVRGAEGKHTVNSDFGTLFAQYLAADLQGAGYQAMVVNKDSDVAKLRYVVEGKFDQIEGGSRAMRFWVGMGTGAARMTISFKVMRIADNNVVGVITDTASALTNRSEETCFARILVKMANDFSEKIVLMIKTDEQVSPKTK